MSDWYLLWSLNEFCSCTIKHVWSQVRRNPPHTFPPVPWVDILMIEISQISNNYCMIEFQIGIEPSYLVFESFKCTDVLLNAKNACTLLCRATCTYNQLPCYSHIKKLLWLLHDRTCQFTQNAQNKLILHSSYHKAIRFRYYAAWMKSSDMTVESFKQKWQHRSSNMYQQRWQRRRLVNINIFV